MDQIDLENNSWRDKVVSHAFSYANYEWLPTDNNIYHGYDSNGILINTPDIDYISTKYNCGWWEINQYNKGIPYNWGGCSTIEEFEVGIKAGKFAGNVPDSRDNGISKDCVGVDCSGLVTNCWGVTERLSTKSIPEIASELDSLRSLLPGDVILKAGSHVMIFIKYNDNEKTCAQIVDSSRSTGRVLLRTVILEELLQKGYKGFRKNLV
jgi:hypothetical protein